MALKIVSASSDDDKRKAFRIRYRVFGEQCRYLRPQDHPDGTESDSHDSLDTTLSFNAIWDNDPVGTARISLRNVQVARQNNTDYGLPLEHIFDLSQFKAMRVEVVEFARSAVLEEYRGTRIIQSIWGCMRGYSMDKGVYYMITNANLETDSLEHARRIFDLAQQEGIVHPSIRTPAKEPYSSDVKNEGIKYPLSADGKVTLPTIINMYARLGMRFTSGPIYYREFDMCSALMAIDFRDVPSPFDKMLDKAWDKFNQTQEKP